ILNNNQPIIDDKEIIDNDTQNVETEKPSISDTPQTPPISTPKRDKSALKTIGKILGIGGATAAVGAGAYAIKKQSDKNNDTEEE
ncbi:MAG: hypothetical protein IJZ79_04735, partial [Bacilli bacterium]|nr:hypothetical protein [Bacilli bacterium]